MSNIFNELSKDLTQSLKGRPTLKKFGLCLGSIALACLGLVNATHAQTSVTCDPAADAVFGNGKGGPQVPAWLDIVTGTITDAGDNILFVMRVNGPIPIIPSWSLEDDFGQFWWSWRMVNDAANITFVSNGCLQAKGQKVPACYCLDLIWNIQAASFRARLLDDTLCIESSIPSAFSPDRREVVLLVPKALFTNTVLLTNANSFQYLMETFVWKTSSNGNTALTIVDNAPTQTGAGFTLGTWSSWSNTTYGCE